MCYFGDTRVVQILLKKRAANLNSILWKICLETEHFSGIDVGVVRVLERFLQFLNTHLVLSFHHTVKETVPRDF